VAKTFPPHTHTHTRTGERALWCEAVVVVQMAMIMRTDLLDEIVVCSAAAISSLCIVLDEERRERVHVEKKMKMKNITIIKPTRFRKYI